MNALTTTRGPSALAPTTMGDMMKLADMLAQSSMVPPAYKNKPQDVLVACLWGSEVGLNPIQALNGIAIINNRPSIWGDAALALVRGHPACEGIREGVDGEGDAMVAWCEVKRRGQQAEKRTFSVADAKKANLWGKSGPWSQYPKRMLQMRARGFAIRDVFPDALRGVITAEEAQDIPAAEPREVPNLAVNPEVFSTREDKFSALQDSLDTCKTTASLRAYLEQPAHVNWLAKLRRNHPDQAERADEMIRQAVERLSEPEEEPEALPLIAPNGKLVAARGPEQWSKWARAAVDKLEDGAALVAWRRENEPHFDSIAESHPEIVAAVRLAVETRLDEIAAAEGEQDDAA